MLSGWLVAVPASVSVAWYFATPQACRGSGCTSSALMPRSASSRWMSATEGSPSGEPKMSRMSSAAAQPMAMLPSTLSGSPSPPTAPAKRDQPDEDFDDPLQAAGQVGQRSRGHRHEDCDLHDRETQVIAVDHDSAGPPAVTAEHRDEDQARHDRDNYAQRDVPGQHPAPGDQGQQHQRRRDAVRPDLIDHRDQPGDAARRRMDDFGDGPVDARVVPDDQQAADQAENGQHEPYPVAAAAAALAVPGRGEEDGPPAGQHRRLGRGSRGPHRILSL